MSVRYLAKRGQHTAVVENAGATVEPLIGAQKSSGSPKAVGSTLIDGRYECFGIAPDWTDGCTRLNPRIEAWEPQLEIPFVRVNTEVE